jgi:repressor LexA
MLGKIKWCFKKGFILMTKDAHMKPGPKPTVGLTQAQRDTMRVIRQYQQQHGMSPTVRDVADARGIKSSSAIEIIQQLESKGHLKRGKGKARAIELIEPATSIPVISQVVPVEILGQVAAGHPILAIEDRRGEFLVDSTIARGHCFALEITGDSMIDAGIDDRDFVIVRSQETAINGEVVIALLEDEATCKTFYKRDSHIELKPENTVYPVIVVPPDAPFKILGKVIAIRKTEVKYASGSSK